MFKDLSRVSEEVAFRIYLDLFISFLIFKNITYEDLVSNKNMISTQ